MLDRAAKNRAARLPAQLYGIGPGDQRGLNEFDTHAAAGTRNQPDFLAHHILNFCALFAEPLNPVRELRTFITLVCELCDRQSEWLQVPRDS